MLSRRILLSGAAVGAASTLLPTPALARPAPAAPLTCDIAGWRSRRPRAGTSDDARPEPWSQRLPLPPRLEEPEVELAIVNADVELLPGSATPMLTFNGTFPGPTIVARHGEPTTVRLRNDADEGAVLHLHGGHVPAEHDGHVRDVVPAGGQRAFVYPNTQRPATLWYHDHLLMGTAERVYRGLAGCYLLLDPGEADLGLPVGDERDVPVVLTDKAFADDGSLVYDVEGHQPFIGDVVLVNGADRPRLEVAAGLVRLRFLNASNARGYRLRRVDGQPLRHVATDGGLLAAPTDRANLELWPSERVEVLLDLSRAEVGEQIEIADSSTPLLRVDVVAGAESPPALVTSFPALEELPAPEVTREITLDEADGRFLLNGHGYDGAIRDVYARFGAVERWRFVNTTTTSHPMHLHLVSFRVRARSGADGAALDLRDEDEGWKDTVLVRAFETVEVDARFGGHLGDFMYHCHVLEHEDHDMMSQFRVVDLARVAGRNRVETCAAVLDQLRAEPRVVAVASGLDWPAALAGAAAADALALVVGGTLDPAVEAALRDRPPKRIVVIGGEGEVPTAVEEALAAIAPTERIAGADPVDTAAAVATALSPGAESAVVATVEKWPDALAAGTTGLPVLLTDPTSLSPATRDALDALGVGGVVIAGGTAAVGRPVAEELAALGLTVERVWGPDRFATAAAFARRAGLSGTVWAASGLRFPDALAAGVASRGSGSLVLVGDGPLPPATAGLIAEVGGGSGLEAVRVVGGEGAVPLAAETALAETLVPGWAPAGA